eukprot:7964673-Pyramimonas_sp.AAC.1
MHMFALRPPAGTSDRAHVQGNGSGPRMCTCAAGRWPLTRGLWSGARSGGHPEPGTPMASPSPSC